MTDASVEPNTPPADSPAPQGRQPGEVAVDLAPRPRLFFVLLACFVAWIAYLVVISLQG